MLEIKFDDKKVRKALKNIQKEIKNPKTLMNQVGQREVLKAEKRVRSSKQDPENQSWAPWAYETLLQRIREGNTANGILYRTGALLRSFYYKASRRMVSISSSIPYAKYLQFGTPKMPKREILGWGVDSFKTLPIVAKQMINKWWK